MNKPIVWSIAGSDSSGGAGIQADLITLHNFAVHGCNVITAITAQNSAAVDQIYFLSAEKIAAQMNALRKNFFPAAIKIGMLGNKAAITTIANFLKTYSGKVIVDPVMAASSGSQLFTHDLQNYISQLRQLFPYVDLLTPNIAEAEKLLQKKLRSYKDIEYAAREILSLGVRSVLIKGGHFNDKHICQDFWSNGINSFWLANSRLIAKNYRGTGCVLATAIAALLACGYSIKDAIVVAKMYVNRGIRLAQPIAQDAALLWHDNWPEQEIDLPYVVSTPLQQLPVPFSDCGTERLGLYPIVDSVAWLEKLLPLGIKTIQLRIKDKQADLAEEIARGILLAQQHHARLFINDYWELAIRYGAYGVHLGQEDLMSADIAAIHAAGLRLGISTHCYYEVARAHALKPSYLACGPIFPTTSKQIELQPQGITQLKLWRRILSYPLVAIGGIHLENLDDILTTKVDGIALISAITKATDPIATTQRLLEKITRQVF